MIAKPKTLLQEKPPQACPTRVEGERQAQARAGQSSSKSFGGAVPEAPRGGG